MSDNCILTGANGRLFSGRPSLRPLQLVLAIIMLLANSLVVTPRCRMTTLWAIRRQHAVTCYVSSSLFFICYWLCSWRCNTRLPCCLIKEKTKDLRFPYFFLTPPFHPHPLLCLVRCCPPPLSFNMLSFRTETNHVNLVDSWLLLGIDVFGGSLVVPPYCYIWLERCLIGHPVLISWLELELGFSQRTKRNRGRPRAMHRRPLQFWGRVGMRICKVVGCFWQPMDLN